jgi:hypothetical protein
MKVLKINRADIHPLSHIKTSVCSDETSSLCIERELELEAADNVRGLFPDQISPDSLLRMG